MKYFLLLLLLSTQCHSVMINPKGLGDAQIIPYYTVNNNLNTLVTVTNTTEKAKAIKISVREGLNGYAALTYNVYLDAFDTWTFALVATTSTQAGAIGQPSAMLVSFDQSCAPLLIKFGHEFSATNLIDGPQDLQRTREGFIEIIEMGDLAAGTAAATAAAMNNIGTPVNCGFFEQAWEENGVWHEPSGGNPLADLTPGSGGLLTESQIIDVAAGINYSIPTIALDGFHADETKVHVAPEDESLSLDAAEPVARVIVEGKSFDLELANGIDAVSAVLMTRGLTATYVLDSAAAGQTELIYSQPTRRFYIDPVTFRLNIPPFNTVFTGNDVCAVDKYWGVEANQTVFDRESVFEYYECRRVTGGCPPRPRRYLCGGVFTQSILLENNTGLPNYRPPSKSLITQSNNFGLLYSPINQYEEATENGFILTGFADTKLLEGTDIRTGESKYLSGLPIIGLSLQRFTNANANEGLLAQYGGTQMMEYQNYFEEIE